MTEYLIQQLLTLCLAALHRVTAHPLLRLHFILKLVEDALPAQHILLHFRRGCQPCKRALQLSGQLCRISSQSLLLVDKRP